MGSLKIVEGVGSAADDFPSNFLYELPDLFSHDLVYSPTDLVHSLTHQRIQGEAELDAIALSRVSHKSALISHAISISIAPFNAFDRLASQRIRSGRTPTVEAMKAICRSSQPPLKLSGKSSDLWLRLSDAWGHQKHR